MATIFREKYIFKCKLVLLIDHLEIQMNHSWILNSTSSLRPTAQQCKTPCVLWIFKQIQPSKNMREKNPFQIIASFSCSVCRITFAFNQLYHLSSSLHFKNSCLCLKPDLENKHVLAVAQEAFTVISKFPTCSCTKELEKSQIIKFTFKLPSVLSEYAPHPNWIAIYKVLLWNKMKHIGGT